VKNRQRLDKIIVDKGLVKNRERAKALIMAGKVIVDGSTMFKAGTLIDRDASIVLNDGDIPYVSRGGLKLEAALNNFGISPEDKIVMDIGCSTGGFTDCVLKKGALKVYAVDVGYGQLDWSLRQDPRIILLERKNFRYLEKDMVPESVDIAVIDVSFISLLKILPRVPEFLVTRGEVVALIKPQFEVGKEMVEKGGIIKDESKRMFAVEKVCKGAERIGFRTFGIFESPIKGQKGNREYFIHMRRN
jgi:23S rRNA (cytidine1920-2'-O)/16S rRNA (cytidine1409-2'-O)-methyltransferase